MIRLSSAALLAGFSVAVLAPWPALARELPEIAATAANAVPACATPGRLTAFLESRNKRLDPRFSSVATEYMRHGEALGLRWDIAFFQMMMETGNLGFTGDVKADQNNFAGLGATGGGVPGESFKDISTGVLAHLQHVLLYSGARVENPVAERTRKVQEWNVIAGWYKDVKGPRTYSHLAKRWAPGSAAYPRDIAAITDAFYKSTCSDADPHPEWVEEARGGKAETRPALALAEPESTPPPAEEPAATPAVGVPPTTPAAPIETAATAEPAPGGAEKPKPSFKVLNEQKPPPDPAASAESAAPAPNGGAEFQTAGAAGAVAQKPTPSANVPPTAPSATASPCKVWTASYGGSKAIIIKATSEKTINYTVLDVNDGKEKREAEAYIAAYAKGGETVGEFPSQTQALDKAFELCPEG